LNEKDLENLNQRIEKDNSIMSLSTSFEQINNAFEKSCKSIAKSIFDFNFSRYLFYHYIILNKTKTEIGFELGISSSTIYYYIKKYHIIKDAELKKQKILQTTYETCQEKYGLSHPGELLDAHQKRISNIVNKSNGQYNKTYYKHLKRSRSTRNKMKEAQQNRRKRESDINNG